MVGAFSTRDGALTTLDTGPAHPLQYRKSCLIIILCHVHLHLVIFFSFIKHGGSVFYSWHHKIGVQATVTSLA
jgi:hypothetical protein